MNYLLLGTFTFLTSFYIYKNLYNIGFRVCSMYSKYKLNKYLKNIDIDENKYIDL